MQKGKQKSNEYMLTQVRPLLDPLIHAFLQLRPERPLSFLLSYFGASLNPDEHIVSEIAPRRRARMSCRCVREEESDFKQADVISQQQESLGVIGLYENPFFRQFTAYFLRLLIRRAVLQNYSLSSKIYTTDDQGAVLLISGSLRESFSTYKIIHKGPKLIASEELVFRINKEEQLGRQLFVLEESRVLRISRGLFSKTAREQSESIERMSKKALSRANRRTRFEHPRYQFRNQESFLSDPNLLYLVIEGSLKLYQATDLQVKFRDQILPGDCLMPEQGLKAVAYEALLLVFQLEK